MNDKLTRPYDPATTENLIYDKWEKSGYFNPDNLPKKGGEPFTIIMPPANANGSLHAGHGLVITLEDIMTRYKRMRGFKALWVPGSDHAGFETQIVYEKKLEKEGRSRFGMDWTNWLLRKYGHNHWCLTVDPDELLVYPFCDTRPLRALTDWLDASSIKSFGAMLLDMYPKGPVDDIPYKRGTDPLSVCQWFDSGNYIIERNPTMLNLWIQGGPRARTFFHKQPERAPALNKVPLVRWQRHYTYVSSTHMLLPRGLNLVYDEWGGEKANGALMHTKFLSSFTDKAREELARNEHYANSVEYKAYAKQDEANPDLWCKWSEKYINWRQLEILGIMSKGNWA
jgi:hypothetical protein